jgi:hypothetical protein
VCLLFTLRWGSGREPDFLRKAIACTNGSSPENIIMLCIHFTIGTITIVFWWTILNIVCVRFLYFCFLIIFSYFLLFKLLFMSLTITFPCSFGFVTFHFYICPCQCYFHFALVCLLFTLRWGSGREPDFLRKAIACTNGSSPQNIIMLNEHCSRTIYRIFMGITRTKYILNCIHFTIGTITIVFWWTILNIVCVRFLYFCFLIIFSYFLSSQVNREGQNQSINTTKDIPVVDNQVCKEVITSDTIQKVVQPFKVHDNIQTECDYFQLLSFVQYIVHVSYDHVSV